MYSTLGVFYALFPLGVDFHWRVIVFVRTRVKKIEAMYEKWRWATFDLSYIREFKQQWRRRLRKRHLKSKLVELIQTQLLHLNRPYSIWSRSIRQMLAVFLLPGISRQQTIFLRDLRFFVQWFDGSMVQWFDGSMVQWFNGSMVSWFDRHLWLQRCSVSGLLKQVLSYRACFSLGSDPPFCFALM